MGSWPRGLFSEFYGIFYELYIDKVIGRQLSRLRGVLIRDHQNMEYQQVNRDKLIGMV